MHRMLQPWLINRNLNVPSLFISVAMELLTLQIYCYHDGRFCYAFLSLKNSTYLRGKMLFIHEYVKYKSTQKNTLTNMANQLLNYIEIVFDLFPFGKLLTLIIMLKISKTVLDGATLTFFSNTKV